MDFLDKRLHVICNELKKVMVVQKETLSDWSYTKGNFVTPEEADQASFEPFDSKTMHWYGPDAHYWFKNQMTLPDTYTGKSVWVNIKTQIEEWDDGKNPQFILFVNGKPLQGLDMNHRKVKLSDCGQGGESLRLDLQAYTGTLHSEFRLIVELMEIDPAIEKLYYDLYVPLSAFPRMDKDDKVRRDIEGVLNEAINYLDLRDTYSEAFYASLKEADAYLTKALYEDMAGYDEVIASCIGHTHIDVAWWWTVAQTREKVGRSFGTVLKLMEEYPDYKFMSSQPQLYVFLKERYPDLYEQVKARVAEGRWEPEGGMWVEADCNLTSGESLIRQFLYGKEFFKEEFGVDNQVLWLPDVFGYSGALPQIMDKCGIKYFMTTKLAWNQFNKVPNDTLMWRGIDGTEILTHLITTLSVGQSTDDFFTTYNGMLHPDALMGGWSRYQNKEINNDILISYGYGDGGGGPTREMLENSKRLEKGVKGLPKVRQVFSGQYFEELEARVADNRRLETWEGEFYFEYHRGTYTSMARNKRSNRKSEFMMMDAELLAVLAKDKGYEADSDQMDAMWKTILLNQFHDILPGTSIKEVYEVTKAEYEAVALKGQDMIEGCTDLIASEAEGVTLFNTTGFERSDVVWLGHVDYTALVDEAGNTYPVQETKKGGVAYVKDLPSKGYKTFRTSHEPVDKQTPFTITAKGIETPFYQVDFDEHGHMSAIYDKENKRQVLQADKKANVFRMYEDKPIYYDNWDIDIFYTEKFWDADSYKSMEWVEVGPTCAVLEIERQISKSVIKQEIRFFADDRKIVFDTFVDWKENQHLLKVHFPVLIHSDEATFDVQFGNVKRKTHTNTSWDKARFESCGHKWIDLSEGHYGVSLLNDCKYGHSVKDSDMALTLIKSGIEPNPTTDQEAHYFTYALYPHKEDFKTAKTAYEGYKLNQPVMVVNKGTVEKEVSLVQVDAPNVIIETIKEARDGQGIILRAYEFENGLTPVTFTFPGYEEAQVYSCNMLEENEVQLEWTDKGFEDTIKPFEVKTYRIVS